MKRGKPLERRTPLRARKSLPRGKHRLQPVSAATRAHRPLREAWSATVLRRDGGRCVAGPDGDPTRRVAEVGCEGRPEPHHINPKSKADELRYDPDNGATLCAAHHRWAHNGDPTRARQLGLLI